jgi:putative spermidine/putrescine transport system permease protein
MAALVTVTDAVLAFPFAYYMARLASNRGRQLLFTAVLLPLWASYIARVYAWIVILQKGGTLSWSFQKLGLGAVDIGYTNTAMWLVFSYIWLPFMIVPVYAALERIPDSLLEASGDLGAHNWRTLRSVLLPLALPGVVAGSIFLPRSPGRLAPLWSAGQLELQQRVCASIGRRAARRSRRLAMVPIVIMIFYLLGARFARRSVVVMESAWPAAPADRVGGVLLFLFVPSRSSASTRSLSNIQSWPIHGLA